MPGIKDALRQKKDQLSFEIDKHNRMVDFQRQIDAVKKQNADDVIAIGTKVLELYRQGRMPIEGLAATCKGILEREKEIAELQARLAAIQQEVMPRPAPPPQPPMPSQPMMPTPRLVTSQPITPIPAAALGVPCPTCQTWVVAGTSFCPSCGEPMNVTTTAQVGVPCPGCGTPTVAGAAFCGECGYNLQEPAPSVPALSPSAPPVMVAGATMMPPLPPVSELATSTSPVVSAPVSISAVDSASLQQIDAYAAVPTPSASEADLSCCPTCGAVQRRPDVRFCFVCGNSMTSPSSPQEPVQ